MQARKILFPTDFSEISAEALEMASTLAHDTGATLLMLHVGESTPIAAGESYYGLAEPDVDALLAQLKQLQPTDPSVHCEYRVETGDPIAAILHVAKQEACDMIVMATHGRQGLSRFFMGSIAEEVVRRASCPVLTVKHHVEEPAMA
jgi:universal stress protein A